MTWDGERQRFSRRPFHYVEWDYDLCQLTYGTAPCTASLGVTGADRCYNGRATCQDPDNIDLATATVRLCQATGDMPRGIDALPLLDSVSSSPSRIEPGKGLGRRAELVVTLRDAPHHDRGFDPYVADRAYDPTRQGSFCGKFLARWPYYLGRSLRWYSGYLTQTGQFDAANFQARHYIIEKVEGPDASGAVRITAKDVLKLADDDRSQAPRPSTGRLLAGIDDDDTSATLNPSGIGNDEYPASGKVRIGREVCAFTRSADVLTLTRGQAGTVAESHSADDTVQLCLEYASESVQDIVYDLLTEYAMVPAGLIPKTDWDNETSAFLQRLYGALITEPVGVNKLISELVEQVPFYVWGDERFHQVRFRAIKAPDPEAPQLTDDAQFIAGSVQPGDEPDQRVSQTWVYFGQIDPTEKIDEARNFKRLYVLKNADAEGDEKFGQPAIKIIYSRWINEFNQPAAADLAAQVNARYAEIPKALAFKLDARAAELWTGDVFRAATRYVQGPSGAPANSTMQVMSARERNNLYEYETEQFAYVAPDDGGVRQIIIGSDTRDVNLRAAHDSIYAAPTGSEVIECIISPGVVVGSEAAVGPAFEVGSWPGGQPITIINYGRIQGPGGRGGEVGHGAGLPGGVALDASGAPVTVDNQGGIWGGGGGGAIGKFLGPRFIGGGGGAGDRPGSGGVAGCDPVGNSGTRTAGGAGIPEAISSGGGGAPGQAGQSTAIDVGGTAGAAVVGNANITWTNTGDRLGPIT